MSSLIGVSLFRKKLATLGCPVHVTTSYHGRVGAGHAETPTT